MNTCTHVEVGDRTTVTVRCNEPAVEAYHGYLCQKHLWADHLRVMQKGSQKAPKRDLEIEQIDGIVRGDLRKINRGVRVATPVCNKAQIKINYLEVA